MNINVFRRLSHFVVPSTLLVNCWSTGITNVLACTDGSFCNKETHADGWNCCGVGLRALCPADHYACNSAATNTVDFTCQDYTPHCSDHSGLKVCPGEFSHFKLHTCLLSVCYYDFPGGLLLCLVSLKGKHEISNFA